MLTKDQKCLSVVAYQWDLCILATDQNMTSDTWLHLIVYEMAKQ
jgi:hypothetical protein